MLTVLPLVASLLFSSTVLASTPTRSPIEAVGPLGTSLNTFSLHNKVLIGRIVLNKRQGFTASDVPAQCQNACADIVTAINDPSCQANSCSCTNRTVNSLAACLNCILDLAPSVDASGEAQVVVDDFVRSCATTGNSVTPVSVNGATAAPSATRSATNTASASVRGVTSSFSLPSVTPFSFTNTFSSLSVPRDTATIRNGSPTDIIDSDSAADEEETGTSGSNGGGLGAGSSGSNGRNGAVHTVIGSGVAFAVAIGMSTVLLRI